MPFSEFKRQHKRTLNRGCSLVLLNPVLYLPNCASPQEQERGSATLFLSCGILLPPPPHWSELSHRLFLGVVSLIKHQKPNKVLVIKQEGKCRRSAAGKGDQWRTKPVLLGLHPATGLRTRRNNSHCFSKLALQSARSKGTLLPCWLSPNELAWKEDECNGGNYSLQTTLTSIA